MAARKKEAAPTLNDYPILCILKTISNRLGDDNNLMTHRPKLGSCIKVFVTYSKKQKQKQKLIHVMYYYSEQARSRHS